MSLKKRRKMDKDDPDKFAPMTEFEARAIDSANRRATNEEDPEQSGNHRMSDIHRSEGNRISEGFQMLSESEDNLDDDSELSMISNQ